MDGMTINHIVSIDHGSNGVCILLGKMMFVYLEVSIVMGGTPENRWMVFVEGKSY